MLKYIIDCCKNNEIDLSHSGVSGPRTAVATIAGVEAQKPRKDSEKKKRNLSILLRQRRKVRLRSLR